MLEWIENHYVGVGIVSIVCCFLWGKRITEYYVGSAEIWAEMVSSCSEDVESLEAQSFVKSQPQSQPVQEVESQNTHLISSILRKSNPQSQPVQEVVSQNTHPVSQSFANSKPQSQPVQEVVAPQPCTKCSGKGSVIVPAKKCTKCQNGTVEMPCECSLGKYDPRRSFYQGLCNGFAGVYPNPRVRWGYLSKKNQKNLLDCKRISKDDETLDAKTIFEMNFNFADRFDDRQFLRNLDSQGISSRLGRNLGCLHIVYCMDYHFKKKNWFWKFWKYKCENLNNLVQNVQSDSKCNNYCDKCKLCNKCGGNILCNICQGRLVRYEDCKNVRMGMFLKA